MNLANLEDLSPFFDKRDSLCDLQLSFGSFWKGVYSIRKEFALNGSKFFPFTVDIFFQKNGKIILTE